MNKLSLLFRRSNLAFSPATAVSRAPKKKDKKGGGGGKGGAAPVSDDIVNIFKDRQDPVILPSEYYPNWLFENLGSQMSVQQRVEDFEMGRFIPYGKEQITFQHNIKRFLIRLQNEFSIPEVKDDWKEPDDGELAYILKKDAEEAMGEDGEEGEVPNDDDD